MSAFDAEPADLNAMQDSANPYHFFTVGASKGLKTQASGASGAEWSNPCFDGSVSPRRSRVIRSPIINNLFRVLWYMRLTEV